MKNTKYQSISSKVRVIAITIIFISCTLVGCGKKNVNSDDVIDTTITIDYDKVKLSYNDDANIYVDGEKIGTISVDNVKKFTVGLTEGTHEIKAVSDTTIRKNRSNKVKFNVTENDCYFGFHMEQGSIWGLRIEPQ